MLRILLIITTQLTLFGLPATAVSQERSSTQQPPRRGRRGPPPKISIEIFKLVHADCLDISNVLNETIPGANCSVDRRTNSVIFAGAVDDLRQVQRLIEALDVPADDASPEGVVMIQLDHRGAKELARQVAMILPGRDLHVAADEGRATVILRGSASHLAAAQRMLNQLDSAPAIVNLEFAFFHAELNDDPDAPEEKIPHDLAEVANELKRFGRLELLGRLSTVAVEHEDFRIEGGIAENLMAVVEGELRSASDEGAVGLRVESSLRLDKARPADKEDKAKRRGSSPTFELRTVILTKRGDYVVLGSAPTGWAPGESVILVLHVRP